VKRPYNKGFEVIYVMNTGPLEIVDSI